MSYFLPLYVRLFLNLFEIGVELHSENLISYLHFFFILEDFQLPNLAKFLKKIVKPLPNLAKSTTCIPILMVTDRHYLGLDFRVNRLPLLFRTSSPFVTREEAAQNQTQKREGGDAPGLAHVNTPWRAQSSRLMLKSSRNVNHHNFFWQNCVFFFHSPSTTKADWFSFDCALMSKHAIQIRAVNIWGFSGVSSHTPYLRLTRNMLIVMPAEKQN